MRATTCTLPQLSLCSLPAMSMLCQLRNCHCRHATQGNLACLPGLMASHASGHHSSQPCVDSIGAC